MNMKYAQPSVYIAGPISGIKQGNLAAFRFAEDIVARTLGAETISPMDIEPEAHDGPCPTVGPPLAEGTTHRAACHLKADLGMLVTCDYIMMLIGWEASAGALLEMQVAARCGIPILFFSEATGNVFSADGELVLTLG